jgi:hypothetical protein
MSSETFHQLPPHFISAFAMVSLAVVVIHVRFICKAEGYLRVVASSNPEAISRSSVLPSKSPPRGYAKSTSSGLFFSRRDNALRKQSSANSPR